MGPWGGFQGGNKLVRSDRDRSDEDTEGCCRDAGRRRTGRAPGRDVREASSAAFPVHPQPPAWQVGGTSRPQDRTGSRGSDQGDDALSQARTPPPLPPTEPAQQVQRSLCQGRPLPPVLGPDAQSHSVAQGGGHLPARPPPPSSAGPEDAAVHTLGRTTSFASTAVPVPVVAATSLLPRALELRAPPPCKPVPPGASKCGPGELPRAPSSRNNPSSVIPSVWVSRAFYPHHTVSSSAPVPKAGDGRWRFCPLRADTLAGLFWKRFLGPTAQ